MASATATIVSVSSFDGRAFSFGDYRWIVRAIGRNAVMAFAAVVAIGVAGAIVTMAAAWIVNTTLGTRHTTPVTVTGTLARANGDAKWPLSSTGAVALVRPQLEIPDDRARRDIAAAPDRLMEAKSPYTLTFGSNQWLPLPSTFTPERARSVPLPQPRPAQLEVARAPIAEPAPQSVPQNIPQVAAAAPPPAISEKRVAPQVAHNKPTALPDRDSRTAVYDISARTVYLPGGEKLEAHSGLGDKMDDPQHIRVRMRGPTPPNVYELTMRERLFHGVRAIRLNPVDDSKMFGRDGMLAHSYMLGPNGQSNGCVSFKDYDRFLQAFLDGEVDRMIVVTHLDGPLPDTPRVARRGNRGGKNFNVATSYQRADTTLTW